MDELHSERSHRLTVTIACRELRAHLCQSPAGQAVDELVGALLGN